MRMRIGFIIGLAMLVVFLAGYGGVLSIGKTFDAPLTLAEVSRTTPVSTVNESEHAECLQNDSESDGIAASLEKSPDGAVTLGKVVFSTSLESGMAQAKKSGKPVFLYLHSRSCSWCKKFEEEVLTNNSVSLKLRESFISVAVEVDEQKEVANEFKVWGTPTMVFLDGEGREIKRIRGFVDSETFANALDGVKG